MPPPKARQHGRGVALGVLGTMLLVFFSLVFMLGKHSHIPHPHDHVDTTGPHKAFDARRTGADSLMKRNSPTNTRTGVLIDSQPTSQASTQRASTGTGGQTDTVPSAITEPIPSPVVSNPDIGSTASKPSTSGNDKEDEEGVTQLDREYRPTKEMVQKIAQDGYLVVTWANWHYQDFVRTWIMHCDKSGITGYIVGAMDDHLLQVLIDQKRNVFSMKSGLTLGDFGWGSKTFAKMGREKIRLIKLFLQLGVHVIITDVDALWLRNPIPYFKQFPDADILTSSDHLANSVDGYELENPERAWSAANIGIMLFREKSMEFVNEWIDVIEKDEQVWDQNAFNDLFRRGVKYMPDNPQHLFKAYNGKLTMGILPVSVFCSGHTFYVQKLWQRLKLEPYAVHGTFQFSGTPGKRNRMREAMLFDDPPDYYDHKGGFITFQMDGLDALLPNSTGPLDGSMKIENTVGHFALVNHQTLRIRNAFAIGTTLGRAVVMPPLWCGQDRFWAPHPGRIAGSNTQLPYQCPMDHVFNLEEGATSNLPADTYGPMIDFKEHSFLDNPRLPSSVRDSKLVVEVCEVGDTTDCSDGTSPAQVKSGKVRIQPGLQSEQLRVALREAAGYKVLSFNTMNKAFSNFTSTGDWTKFFNRIKLYGSIWCCVNQHPGHVHYDLWWDIPHTDKFNREWKEWKPTCGP